MNVRLSKSILVCSIAFFASLVAFGNITDFWTNFKFVQHVMMMDTIFPDASINYRSIQSPWIHHVGYIIIISLETLTAILCWIGGIRLLMAVKKEPEQFNSTKKTAVAGLTLDFWYGKRGLCP